MTEGGAPASTDVAGCTVATRNYLADARVAAESFVDHHPGSRFVILVVDGDHMPPAGWSHRDVELVTPSILGFDRDELLRMAAIYDPAELACALKPLALRQALTHAEVAIYLDGDVEILAPMPELAGAGRDHAVVLVPHVLEPMPRDGRLPDETGLLGSGIYNGGLLACGPGSEPFLAWWDVRLRRDCLFQPDLRLLADQRWLDFVPALFDHHILRDPTYDVAYWNLHERPTAWLDGRLCVGDRPVRCFHHSGLTDARPWLLSGWTAERPRVTLAELPAVARQCRAWLERRRAVGAEADRALGYHWARTPRGVDLDGRARWLFRSALLAAEADPTGTAPAPPSPFAPDGGEAWEAWLRQPEDPDGVGRYLQQLWNDAGHLQRWFPEVPGADRAAFLAWVASPDADDAAIPAAFRPRPEELPLPDADEPAAPTPSPSPSAAASPLPLADLDRAHEALNTPARSAPGVAGKAVDRLLVGRDERTAQATTAVGDAVADVARRLAEAEAGLARRIAETEADMAQRIADAEVDLTRRLAAAESDLTAIRGDLGGALEQDRITAGIVADAEERLADEVGELRLRVDELAAEVATEEAPP